MELFLVRTSWIDTCTHPHPPVPKPVAGLQGRAFNDRRCWCSSRVMERTRSEDTRAPARGPGACYPTERGVIIDNVVTEKSVYQMARRFCTRRDAICLQAFLESDWLEPVRILTPRRNASWKEFFVCVCVAVGLGGLMARPMREHHSHLIWKNKLACVQLTEKVVLETCCQLISASIGWITWCVRGLVEL